MMVIDVMGPQMVDSVLLPTSIYELETHKIIDCFIRVTGGVLSDTSNTNSHTVKEINKFKVATVEIGYLCSSNTCYVHKLTVVQVPHY